MIEIKKCPICEGENLNHYLNVKDRTVSGETFQLQICRTCSFVLTNPRPDESEIGKYYLSEDYISHTGRSRNLTDLLYLIARNFTLPQKVKLVSRYGNSGSKTILDFGCGTGDFLHEATKRGYHSTGVEPSKKAREAALQAVPNVHESLENVKDIFSHITLWHVLEHIPDLNNTLSHLKSNLATDGTLFIAVPNHESEDGIKYQEFWAGYDVPRHLWHFNRKTMTELLNKNGLKVKTIIPMKLDPFYISLLSEKYKRDSQSIKGMVNACISGIQSNIKAKKTGDYSSLIYVASR